MSNQKTEKLIRFIILFLTLAFGLLLKKIVFFIIGAIILFIVLPLYFRSRNNKTSTKE
jgi:large-conductance mechanosensitive channel